MELEPDAQVFDAQNIGCRVRGGGQLNRRLLIVRRILISRTPSNRAKAKKSATKSLFLNGFSQKIPRPLTIMLYSEAHFKSRAAMA